MLRSSARQGWAAITAILAARIGRNSIKADHVLIAGAVAVVLVLAFAIPYAGGAFGLAHIIYVTGTAGPAFLALIGAVGLWRGVVPGGAATFAFMVLLLVPGAFGLWATHIAPFSVDVERVDGTVPCQRVGSDEIVVGVLADIQAPRITEHELSVADRVMAESPDIIVIAGDIQQGSSLRDELDGFREFFARLEAPHGVYLADGDVDSVREAQRMIEGSSVQLLVNEIVSLEIGDRRIQLGANGLDWLSSAAQRTVDDLSVAPTDTISVLLTHRPDVAIGLDGRTDLVIAGHTHGGQFALPFLGPLVIASDIPRSIGAGGLHDLAGQAIYVSSGIGMERGDAPQVRLFSPPSFGVITLATEQGCA